MSLKIITIPSISNANKKAPCGAGLFIAYLLKIFSNDRNELIQFREGKD